MMAQRGQQDVGLHAQLAHDPTVFAFFAVPEFREEALFLGRAAAVVNGAAAVAASRSRSAAGGFDVAAARSGGGATGGNIAANGSRGAATGGNIAARLGSAAAGFHVAARFGSAATGMVIEAIKQARVGLRRGRGQNQ
jgi:hypothetical protein